MLRESRYFREHYVRGRAYYRANKERIDAVKRRWYEAHREEVAEYNRRYREVNRERLFEQKRRYREENRERIAEKKRRDYEADPTRAIERSRQWYRDNIEYARARNRQRYEENRVRVAEYHRQFYQANKERYYIYGRRRRARKRNAEGEHTFQHVVTIGDLQEWRCYYCNTDVADGYHVDHMIPLSRGGSDWPDNLVVACPTCNISKGVKTAEEFLEFLRKGA